MAEPVPITVYSREECHLCTEAIDEIERVADTTGVAVDIDVIDVDTDPDLRGEYGERVPYVFVDGEPTFKYRVDGPELRSLLSRHG